MTATSRRPVTRALLAVALCAIAAAMLPARASTTPEVRNTSVDGGWGFLGPVAARFDRELDLGTAEEPLSKVELTFIGKDREGNPVTVLVPGRTTLIAVEGRINDTLLFTPTFEKDQAALREQDAPYTVTFTAQSKLAGEGATTVTRVFNLDLTKPTAKLSRSTGTLLPGTYLPAEQLVLAGSAWDKPSAAGPTYRSGLVGVEVQFYNGLQSSKELSKLRQYPALDGCSLQSPCTDDGEHSFAIDTSQLSTGLWTVRAYAVDAAGNRSIAAQTEFTKI